VRSVGLSCFSMIAALHLHCVCVRAWVRGMPLGVCLVSEASKLAARAPEDCLHVASHTPVTQLDTPKRKATRHTTVCGSHAGP
jgi:hypothetical protein